LNKRLAASLVPALVLGASLFAVGNANADAPNGGCRKPPVSADSLLVSTCITRTGPGSAYGSVKTTGTNNTLIDLCVEIVDVNQNLVGNSRDCQIQHGEVGQVTTPTLDLAPGTYYAQSYFTTPTYWYGGESPALVIS
jgi:hypothetical protein